MFMCTGRGGEIARGWMSSMAVRWRMCHMLTVVILLAFLSMSALLRQGYLLVPEKAEMADPAHAPRLFSLWLIMCVCAAVCVCLRCVVWMRMSVCLMDFCLCIYVWLCYEFCVNVCVTGSPKQGAEVGQCPPIQTSVPGGGVWASQGCCWGKQSAV